MSFDFYDAATPIFVRGLNVALHLIDKAEASGIPEAEVMEARLAPDMRPFSDQIRMSAFGARACVARLTGVEWPKTDDSETSLGELRETVRMSIAFIEGIDSAKFQGAEGRRVEIRFPGVELDFDGSGYLTSFGIPNFYFHVTTAYAILRHRGVELGKRDFLGKLALIGG